MTQQTAQLDLYDRAVRLDGQRVEIAREQARVAAEALVRGILTITPQAREVLVSPADVLVEWKTADEEFFLDSKNCSDWLPKTSETIALMDSVELGGCLTYLCNALSEPRAGDLEGFTTRPDAVELDVAFWAQGA